MTKSVVKIQRDSQGRRYVERQGAVAYLDEPRGAAKKSTDDQKPK